MAVLRLRRLGRDVAALEVLLHQPRVPLAGGAPAATARSQERHHVALSQWKAIDAARQLQALTRTALDDVQRRRPRLAAPQPPRRTAGSFNAAVDEHIV